MSKQGIRPDLIPSAIDKENKSPFDLIKTDYSPRIINQSYDYSSEGRNYLYEESKIIARRKEEKLKVILQEEKKAREFKAKSVPKWVGLLPYKTEDKLRENKPSSPFKAQKIPQSLRIPFMPQHVNKFTQPKSPKFATERRLEEREEFENVKRHREMQLEQAKLEAEKLEKQLNEEEIQRIRKNAQFHAKPMPAYKEFHIKKSVKPLTVPKSPSLSTSSLGRSPYKE